MTEIVSEQTEHIRLGMYGSEILRKGDSVFYHSSEEKNYVPVVVVDPWFVIDEGKSVSARVYVKTTNVSISDYFYAKFEELFWDRNTPIPADRLEDIIEKLSQRGSRGVTVTI